MTRRCAGICILVQLLTSPAQTYTTHQVLFAALRTQAQSCAQRKTPLNFSGKFIMPLNPHESDKERVQLTSRDVWKVTGFRFTVRDHPKSKHGHRTRYFCSQDETSKKTLKPSQNPTAKRRENPGMVRFPCHGRLTIISSRQKDSATRIVSVNLKHAVPHVAYYDVSLPAEAADIIRENMEWCTPSELVKRIQARFPSATANQIGDAWRSLSEMFWKRDTDQLASALKLLAEFPDEVDVFKLQDNTNARQLELYGVLAEYDNAAYCLLSTASSIAISKRKLALTAFGNCLRDTYGVNPEFAHTDKDMAEIGMLKDVWDPKINQCWWHVDDAVGKRLKSAKLSTTPYDSQRAHTEFNFIDMSFVPPGKDDPDEFEGGYLEPVSQAAETHNPSKLTVPFHSIRITPPAAPRLNANGIPLLRIPVLHFPAGEDVEMAEEEDTKNTKRTFCRAVCRDPIRAMMKPHAFAHPLIPGYCHPSKEGIKYWAVKQAYDYCVEHDLREVWAYLWGNWYRSGRWELWARSAHPTIPRLRTTMICESQ
ncbi:hypothetical protein GGX14DRAFT_359361 [Mycena pura]|uniref:Uncharacterized protein n=1 Tax=Mycena pura TaxID=153505 RepID=A0AAD6VKF8_9AGAR|nr:hypothetical protein GGX14DRAFT_359361 [Mycena pura]